MRSNSLCKLSNKSRSNPENSLVGALAVPDEDFDLSQLAGEVLSKACKTSSNQSNTFFPDKSRETAALVSICNSASFNEDPRPGLRVESMSSYTTLLPRRRSMTDASVNLELRPDGSPSAHIVGSILTRSCSRNDIEARRAAALAGVESEAGTPARLAKTGLPPLAFLRLPVLLEPSVPEGDPICLLDPQVIPFICCSMLFICLINSLANRLRESSGLRSMQGRTSSTRALSVTNC
uniref:Uncharacterized protein n=1 Tax=Opuntia streptacantha TaxID=393608 RepID=A0A7C9AJW7_OPUST